MKKDYSKEFISEEISQLFKDVENFIVKKDSMIDAIRCLYLSTSCNN